MKYQHLDLLLPGEYDGRLRDGWFKYGAYLQRPLCAGCRECLSMRVPVDEFTLSRAQRRALEKNADLTVICTSPPICDEERVNLHNRYRASQFVERGWSPLHRSLESYYEEFVMGPSLMTEIAVWDAEGSLASPGSPYRRISACSIILTPNWPRACRRTVPSGLRRK